MSLSKLGTAILFTSLLAACGGEKEERAKIDAQVTETRMDDIDQIQGTINDDMINMDDANTRALLAKDEGNSAASGEKDSEGE